MKCGWDLRWTLHCNLTPHIGGSNTYLDLEISTIYIRPNEDLTEFYSRTINIHKNIQLSKATIYPNIIIKHYLEIYMSYPNIRPFLYDKKYIFSGFLSSHNNNYIYKSDNIISITNLTKKCNNLDILTPYFQSSTQPQRSVIPIIHHDPISSKYNPHQHITVDNPKTIWNFPFVMLRYTRHIFPQQLHLL